MKFESFTAFIEMGGHGPYIWSAYAITIVVLTANIWWPAVARKKIVNEQRRAEQRRTGESA